MFWSDSMSVPRYVKNESTRFHRSTSPDQCRYVEGVALQERWLPMLFWAVKDGYWGRSFSGSQKKIGLGTPHRLDVFKTETRRWRWFTRFVTPLYPSRRILWLSTFKARLHGTDWRSQLHLCFFLRYGGNLQRLSKRGKSRDPIIFHLPPITISEMEIVLLEIFGNAQQFYFP